MITLYTGTPGSGKSLHLIQVILRCLSWNREVICNFPISFTEKEIAKGYDKRFYYMTNDEITVNKLLEFAIDNEYLEKRKESQCLVVIDEAGGRFNSRDYNNKDRSAWLDFFSQHRKLGFDFILVAQQDRMIDRQIRGQIETEKRHRKCNNYSIFALLPFPLFVAIEYWYTAKLKVSSEFFFYNKKYGNKYDTFKMFSGFKLPPEILKKIEDKKNKQIASEAPEALEGSDVSINAIFKEGED